MQPPLRSEDTDVPTLSRACHNCCHAGRARVVRMTLCTQNTAATLHRRASPAATLRKQTNFLDTNKKRRPARKQIMSGVSVGRAT